MKKTIKALSRQLFGAKYESIGKSLLFCGILFFALYAAEIRLVIAPYILYLTSTVFTACIMLQMLHSSRHTETMQGLYMLPFGNRDFIFSYVLSLGGYTLITKTLPVWTIFFIIGSWSSLEIAVAVLCGCNICFVSAVICLLYQKRKRLLPIIWIICILANILVIREPITNLIVSLLSLAGAVWYLSGADAYDFYHSSAAKKAVRHTKNSGNVLVYLVRYLLADKSYLLNTAGLCAVACFLPLLFGKLENLNFLPVGFAILSLNTPICTLLSSEPHLEQAVHTLPGQASRFCSRYGLFLYTISFSISCVYLCCWQLLNGGIKAADIWVAVLFNLQSAILSVLLEWKRPVRNWKTISDLWHHPRKYLVPLLLMLTAALIGIWPPVIWIWSGILLIECSVILCLSRRP